MPDGPSEQNLLGRAVSPTFLVIARALILRFPLNYGDLDVVGTTFPTDLFIGTWINIPKLDGLQRLFTIAVA